MVAIGTYSSHLAEEFMPVFNGNHAFAIAEIVDGSCHENDVPCDQSRRSAFINKYPRCIR